MANASTLAAKRALRMMLVGYPGSGKTGALAPLANAGLKLRILDFDGNLEPLWRFVKPECLGNIDVLSFEDKLRSGQKHIEVAGLPTAFADAVRAMDRWKYTDEAGREVDLGASKDWGLDTVVVLDSLTSMGLASFRRAQAMLNKTPTNTTQQVWGLAMADQEAFIEKLTSTRNGFHLIVLGHLKMIGPKDIQKDDSDTTKELKERVAELVPTRLFPSALGQALPPQIGGHFPTLLLIEPEYKGKNVRRVIRTVPRPELDLKIPAPDLPPELDISDGLLTVFNALTPGVEACLAAGKAQLAKTEKE